MCGAVPFLVDQPAILKSSIDNVADNMSVFFPKLIIIKLNKMSIFFKIGQPTISWLNGQTYRLGFWHGGQGTEYLDHIWSRSQVKGQGQQVQNSATVNFNTMSCHRIGVDLPIYLGAKLTRYSDLSFLTPILEKAVWTWQKLILNEINQLLFYILLKRGPRCSQNMPLQYYAPTLYLYGTGYKIKDDRNFLGTFIMSFNALVTHIFRY